MAILVPLRNSGGTLPTWRLAYSSLSDSAGRRESKTHAKSWRGEKEEKEPLSIQRAQLSRSLEQATWQQDPLPEAQQKPLMGWQRFTVQIETLIKMSKHNANCTECTHWLRLYTANFTLKLYFILFHFSHLIIIVIVIVQLLLLLF